MSPSSAWRAQAGRSSGGADARENLERCGGIDEKAFVQLAKQLKMASAGTIRNPTRRSK
jgi:hypothetical protein